MSAFVCLSLRVCFALVCVATISIHADTTTVTNTNDSGPGSLRQALADAIDGETINFDPALNGRNISLTSAELVGHKKHPRPRAEFAGTIPVFKHTFSCVPRMPNWTVTIAGLTISGGGAGEEQGGGGILNDHATLTIDSCAVQNASPSPRWWSLQRWFGRQLDIDRL